MLSNAVTMKKVILKFVKLLQKFLLRIFFMSSSS